MPNPLARALVLSTKAGAFSTPALTPAYRLTSPVFSDWDSAKGVREGYKVEPIVFACVDRRAAAVSSVPWYVEERQRDGEWERVPGHPLEELLENPNPDMSRQDLFEILSKHLDLAGNALWSLVTASNLRSGGQIPVELWPLDPSKLKPIPGRGQLVRAYQYIDGETREIPAEQVLHFKFQDPANPYWGMAPLMAIARAVDTSVEILRWNKVALQNRGMPDGVYTFDQPLTREEWEEARNEIHQNYNSPDNARLPLVLASGARFEVVSWKPIDLDFIAGLEYCRETITSVYGVPPTLIGILKDATLANFETSLRFFWTDTAITILEGLRATFNRVLTPRFGPRNKLRVCYDLSGVPVLREDFGEKVKQYEILVRNGQPPNAAAKRLGMDLDDVPGGDTPLVPGTLVALTDLDPREQAKDRELELREQKLRMIGQRMSMIPVRAEDGRITRYIFGPAGEDDLRQLPRPAA
jgi:HK97 family phage portal protein